jgi:hypothetical protein
MQIGISSRYSVPDRGDKAMKICKFVLGMAVTTSILLAQGPMYDKITVTLPYAVNVNGTVLQAGDYVIREHESTAGSSRVVHFFRDQGLQLETTAMAIPALDSRTPRDTKLVLDRFGPDYYLNKIWVQGKDYGYEFPIPDSVRMREQERTGPANVVARFEVEPAPAVVAQTEQTTTREETRTETAQTTTPPPPPAAQPEPTPAPAPEPTPAPAPVEQAQAQPPATPAPEAAAPAPEAADRTMPATAANWLNLLLGGGLLASSGLALRRFRA